MTANYFLGALMISSTIAFAAGAGATPQLTTGQELGVMPEARAPMNKDLLKELQDPKALEELEKSLRNHCPIPDPKTSQNDAKVHFVVYDDAGNSTRMTKLCSEIFRQSTR